ncbi:MAG: class I adenylate-forming enzyme family protein [Thermoplasmata archaeon]
MKVDLSRYAAHSYRDSIALEDSIGNKYSFKEVDSVANSFAQRLKEFSISRGQRISVFSDNTPQEVMLFFAAIKLGAALVVHNIRLRGPEIMREVEKVKPSLIVTNEYALQELQEYSRDLKVPVLELKDIPMQEGESFPSQGMEMEDTALIIFTGGSTGEPKGAKLSLRSIIFNSLNTAVTWKLSSSDVSLLAYPFYHTGGWNVLTLPLYVAGGRTIVIKRFKPEIIADLLANRGVTVFSTVPALLLEITQLDDFDAMKFPSLRFVKSGGGMTSQTVVNKFMSKGIKIFQGYGLTEAGPNIFYSSEEDLNRQSSLGRKTIFCDLKLVDENGRESDEGELCVSGPIIFSGYIGSEESASAEDQVKTGDILRRDSDGFYYFVGRKKFMYKSGGENIYPTEIESVLETHPSVSECAVIGVPDEKWGEVGKAFVVTRERTSEDELRKFAEKYIAKYKVPKYFVFVESIPKTSAGKKDYISLRKGVKND